MARRNNRQHAMLHSILLVISVSLLRSVMGAQQLHAGSAINIQCKVGQAPFDQKESHSDLEVVSTQAAEQDGGNSDSSSSTFAVSRRRLGQGPVATGSFTSITIPLRVCGNDPTVSNADLTNQVMGSGRSLKSFMDQCSFGSLNFDTSPDNNLIVSTPVPINSVCSGNSVNCNNIDGIGQEAEDWLSNNGYDMTKYSVRILVFPANMPGCPRIGVGRWGCFTNNPGPGTPALICRTWITNGDVVGLIHETGHNLGLSHANLGSQDAGDMTSPMGYTGDYRCHNAYQASLLNWVKPVQTINLNDVSGGQWKNVQLPPRVNSQKNFILLQGSGNDLYVSYTAPVGWEKDVNPADSYQLLVHSQMSDSDWSRSNLLARLNNNQRASISKWVIRVTSTSANGATAQICRQENNGQCQPGTEPSGSASTTNKPKSTPKRELSAEATANSEEKSPQKKLSPRPPPKAAQKKPSPRPPRPPPRKTKA